MTATTTTAQAERTPRGGLEQAPRQREESSAAMTADDELTLRGNARGAAAAANRWRQQVWHLAARKLFRRPSQLNSATRRRRRRLLEGALVSCSRRAAAPLDVRQALVPLSVRRFVRLAQSIWLTVQCRYTVHTSATAARKDSDRLKKASACRNRRRKSSGLLGGGGCAQIDVAMRAQHRQEPRDVRRAAA